MCSASNGYSLFTIETLPTISHLPNNERLGEVSRRWKKLSEDKKEAYNLKAEEVRDDDMMMTIKFSSYSVLRLTQPPTPSKAACGQVVSLFALSFAVSGLTVRNNLTDCLRNPVFSDVILRRHLETFLFAQY